jgi:hypothetical protein
LVFRFDPAVPAVLSSFYLFNFRWPVSFPNTPAVFHYLVFGVELFTVLDNIKDCLICLTELVWMFIKVYIDITCVSKGFTGSVLDLQLFFYILLNFQFPILTYFT